MNRNRFWIWILTALSILTLLAVGCGGPKELDDEEKIRLYYEAGLGYIGRGEPEKALDSFQRAYALDNRYPQVLQGVGLAYHQLGVPESALTWYKKTEEITPNDPALHNNLASIYLQLQDYEKSIHYSTKALENEEYRTPTAAYYNRGLAKKKSGDIDGAKSDFNSALRLDPMYAAPRVELGWLCLQSGDFDRAIKMATSALKLKKNYAEAYLLRGEAYWEQGYVSKAENDFTTVLRLEDVHFAYQEKAHNWLDRIQ